jgi:hypothetical protein
MNAFFRLRSISPISIIICLVLCTGACSSGISIPAGDDVYVSGAGLEPYHAVENGNDERDGVNGKGNVFIPVTGERYAFREYNVSPFDTVWFEDYFVTGRDTILYDEFYTPDPKYAYQEYDVTPNDTIWFDEYFVVGIDTTTYDLLYRNEPEFALSLDFYYNPFFAFFIPVYPFISIELLIENYRQLSEESKIYNYQYYIPDPPVISEVKNKPEDTDRYRRTFIRLSFLSAALIVLSALP